MNKERPSLDTQAEALKVLGHPLRLLIVQHLSKQKEPQSVTEIYSALNIPQAIASQHLITLKDRDILKNNKVGTKIYYSVAQQWVVKVVALVVAVSTAADAEHTSS